MYKPLQAGLIFLASIACIFSSSAAEPEEDEVPVNLSYIYAPLLGTGFYKAGAERAFVLKISLGNVLTKENAERRFRWILPVTLGLRETDFKNLLELDQGFPDELHSLSFMPGLAWPGLGFPSRPKLAAHTFGAIGSGTRFQPGHHNDDL